MQSRYFLWDSDSDSIPKTHELRLCAQNQTLTPTPDVMCDILIVFLRMIWEKI